MSATVKPKPTVGAVFRIADLCALLEQYLPDNQVKEVYRAYLFGAEAHDGQQRLSGEPYITHPLAVAKILADMRMDYQSIMAAILHDVIEDTSTAKDHLTEEFGKEIAELVDGVSKITQIKFNTRAEAQAENLRKMMLAMVRDIRVILIKLADRLHNMRTLGAMPADKRRRIARETLDIYVPLANRLGMNQMRLNLEELGFAALYPMRHRVLREATIKARGNRKEILRKIETAIKRRLRQEELNGEVLGREKHLYSIYRKMRNKQLSLHEVFDVYAFRIIVDTVDTCYRTFGAMHNLYKPVPGKFKDYIAIPKANGYQSLHTVLFGPYGVPIEVQIRTEEMHKVAESGIAAHWMYKTGDSGKSTELRARQWLGDLLELQRNAGNSLEFIESVKIDLFPDEVYVFTPGGDILELPRGATVVDFAYAVHTDVGNTCVAARVDRRLVPLRSVLHNGQTVEIITAPGAKPNPAWMNFVATGKARTNIRSYLKKLRRNEAVNLGRRLLGKALAEYSASLEDFTRKRIRELLDTYQYTDLQELLKDIGLGQRIAVLVARQLVPSEGEDRGPVSKSEQSTRPLVIRGTEGMVVNFAKCCHPLPGDPIIGFVSAGRGIVIHTESCKNVGDFRKMPDKWIDVEWEPEIAKEFTAELRIDVANQRGVLAIVAAAIADLGSNIENVHIEERDGMTTSMIFAVAVRDRRHLARIMRRIRSLNMVMRISRKKG
ncbi:MAG: bifunctional GTP diphosphokinase/guanosine-3',5'-bis pyrophosphate 3'-pyrophosphohydrolase [Gammaproteobacteria bacterium]|nr:bifunctional GTP diphosphokinase/guanosine-3',5'-bis pyrophosphate 3'-pyrophosphohydrolase [Gammaproteobacteria bacterium]NIR97149.1 bifunctional GTP diphosphokinase/guanosine-3',5'-bis pyrophosphate 3'-pyrophosphohydrolase [Gammaproteobacteria bacterium]NIT62847.1 bifunctional GTP diphosphokinase/guanosine-3',5'-bis pyrophosphate 3'-pyrophosphohydrolase [Gammaproteobacteria bacterium]NIV19811.1 bifunctional GTP diphosphokinase/guanosine-3',5'-bis pyrophosphate 3'-pyrophosphohydrolase [Gammap